MLQTTSHQNQMSISRFLSSHDSNVQDIQKQIPPLFFPFQLRLVHQKKMVQQADPTHSCRAVTDHPWICRLGFTRTRMYMLLHHDNRADSDKITQTCDSIVRPITPSIKVHLIIGSVNKLSSVSVCLGKLRFRWQKCIGQSTSSCRFEQIL